LGASTSKLLLTRIQKLYDRNNAITAADTLNDKVLPFFEQHDIPLLRILTDRGTEYCGKPEYHEYELYLQLEGIDHSKTKVRSPQSNGICERLHRTMQDEFYAIAFRKKLYASIEELQKDLDEWLEQYNNERTHSGKYCFGKTPMQTFIDSIDLARNKQLDRLKEKIDNLHPIIEAEAGAAGEQPARNSLSSENEKEVGENPTSFNQNHSLSNAS
jgi:hypothetical protein